ncbi:phage tail sheath protein [Breznakiella homolactica]|uniref:Phage tail sheath protein n=1 Tax=Breznakiella homolactica TaxID=2798577 RepID=A0A7T8BB95_9SPIR|nr:phage tail sheath protein [Breznakiella homolactica]QQO10322.1 phage tail sheath protein [Breznakiella homolactica]
MSISFVQIPENLLVPGQYQEIDNSLAGTTSEVKKALIVGYKAVGGTAEPGIPVQVLTKAKAGELFGYGSPASIMAAAFLELNKVEELWVLPVAEPDAGTKWTQTFSVEGTSSGSGAVNILINGKKTAASVSAGAVPSEIAAAIVATVNGMENVPVDAKVDESESHQVILTSVVNGTAMNGNQISMASTAAGISVKTKTAIDGQGVSDISPLFNNLGETRYNYIIYDFSDKDNLEAIAAELEDRYSATRQIGGRCFVALSGEIGSVSEPGSILAQAKEINSPHICLIPRMNYSGLPCEWAARFAAKACRILADDPAANTYDIEVTGLSAKESVSFEMRQKLLESGIATWRIDTTGNVLIERLVTSYNQNSDGGRDTSYLDIQVVETVDAIRTYINSEAKKRFKTWKLASTGESFGRGAKVMTPAVWRSFLADLYQTVFIQDKQWCQDFDSYKSSIQVAVKNGSKTRLEYLHQPVLIGQFLQAAGLNQFK